MPPISIRRSKPGSPAIRAFICTSLQTYSSWLNQVERWFGLITQQAIRRGSIRNVRQLDDKIEQYVTHYNEQRRPFVWTPTADSIIAKVQRIRKLINGTQHYNAVTA